MQDKECRIPLNFCAMQLDKILYGFAGMEQHSLVMALSLRDWIVEYRQGAGKTSPLPPAPLL